MVKRILAGIATTAFIALQGVQPASAATIINGSFEWGTDPLSITHLNAGDTSITGWTIGGNSIDYVGGWWMAQDGVRSIDLSGSGAGNIAQAINTVIGRKYTVSFYLSGNSDAGPLVKSMRAQASGSAAQTYTFNATHSTHVAMGWLPATYAFTATSASTTLRFASLNEGVAGPALDNVTIAAVPEAGTWAMMVGGFGMLGGTLRRRGRLSQFA